MKIQFKIRNLIFPVENKDVVCNSYVDNGSKDPHIIKNTAHVDFNDKNFDIVRFVKMNSLPAVREHLTPKIFADEALSLSTNDSSIISLDRDEKLKLDEQDSLILNSFLTSPKTIIKIPTKSSVIILHETKRNRRDLSSVNNDQDN